MGGRISTLVLVVLISFTGCVTNPVLGPSADDAFETGLALYDQGRYEDAIEHFNRALELDPEHARSYLYLGRSLFSSRALVGSHLLPAWCLSANTGG